LKNELDKLIAYVESLGVKVLFKPTTSGDDAGEWHLDGKTIIIYEKSLPRRYFMLLHESAHHYEYVVSGKRLRDEEIAAFNKAANLPSGEMLEKKYRKAIYQAEKNDAKHQLTIHKKLNSGVDVKRVKLEIEYSNWLYRDYFITGHYPSMKQRREKRKEDVVHGA